MKLGVPSTLGLTDRLLTSFFKAPCASGCSLQEVLSERLYLELSDYEECNLEDFKSYFKNVWEYFSRYIGFFDIDREDVKIVSYLNHIDTLLYCENISCLEVWRQNACILFLEALIYTISSYDIIRYSGGFYGNGILFIQLPHHAGDNCDKDTINRFDERLNSYCECYKQWEEGV